MSKASAGRFFEDYDLGETIVHAVPRTLSGGERALYGALYPARHALHASDDFARSCGLPSAPLDDLIVFRAVLDRSAPDLTRNAVASLGYADGLFLRPVMAGETLRASSEVIGLRAASSGGAGIVWVRTTGTSRGEPVLRFVRWMLVRKRDPNAVDPDPYVPELADAVRAEQLKVPEGLDFSRYEFALAGEPHRLSDYAVGEVIDHLDGVTVEEAGHMLAPRPWQDTPRAHTGAGARPDGRRPADHGHVISVARALSFAGLANAQTIVAINAGTHANPCFAGDTLGAWSEVLDAAETRAPGVGAIRLRTVATTGAIGTPRGDDGRHRPEVLLDLDYWALMPA